MTSTASSENDKLLYNSRTAMDIVLDEGLIPRRLWRVLYPIYRVEVEGWQREATDFEPIEELIERAIQEARLITITSLSSFFQLEPGYIESIVNHLRAIGHVELSGNRLSLTQLGCDSLLDGRCYRQLLTQHVLYFEAFTSTPLLRAHYRLQIYDQLPKTNSFFPLYPFYPWNSQALEELSQRPDKSLYNLPDELGSNLQLVHTDHRQDVSTVVYVPVYIVEVEPLNHNPNTPSRCLIFSRVQGYRDSLLETAFNGQRDIYAAISATREDKLPAIIAKSMQKRGVPDNAWRFDPKSDWGPKITVSAGTVLDGGVQLLSGVTSPFNLQDVSNYITEKDFCVWVKCADTAVNHQAAIRRVLSWLEHIPYDPDPIEISQRLDRISRQLEIEPPSLTELLAAAEKQGWGQAIERLVPLTSERVLS